jgi:hypothetical protein
MCPACLANAVGLLVGAISSAGVATAYLFRKQLLQKEKELDRQRDALAAEHPDLPTTGIRTLPACDRVA